MLELSFSEIKTLQRCHKLYHYVYVRELTPAREHPHVAAGRWIHVGIAAATTGQDFSEAVLREYDRAVSEVLLEEEASRLRELRDISLGVVSRFLRWHEHEFAGWEVHSDSSGPFVERQVSLDLSEDVRFVGTVDAVFCDPHGKLWVRDYKTQEDFYQNDREYEVLLDTDFQLALYVAALRAAGLPVVGGQHVYIRRRLPQVPRLTKDGRMSVQYVLTDLETVQEAARLYGVEVPEELLRKLPKDAFFRHYETLVHDADVERACRTVLQAAELVRVLERVGYTPHWHYRCPGCPFYEPCLSEWKGGDPEVILQEKYRTRTRGGGDVGAADL